MPQFNYLIVGAGAAGCVLASRLSEDPGVTVLLLEAGHDIVPGKEPADLIDSFPSSYYNKNYFWQGLNAHWRNKSNSIATHLQQAKVMGGGGSVMGMVALRGTPDDYNGWEALGAKGWNWDSVLPYFRKLENDWDFDGDLHGKHGPIPIRRTLSDQLPPLSKAIHEFAAARGIPYIADMNADFRDGYTSLPMSNTPDRRASSAICYLDAAVRSRPNLQIHHGTVAHIGPSARQPVGKIAVRLQMIAPRLAPDARRNRPARTREAVSPPPRRRRIGLRASPHRSRRHPTSTPRRCRTTGRAARGAC